MSKYNTHGKPFKMTEVKYVATSEWITSEVKDNTRWLGPPFSTQLTCIIIAIR